MSDRASLLYARLIGVADLLGHMLGLNRFKWFHRLVCDPYDDLLTGRRHGR